MNLPIVFDADALAEFDSATDWYESKQSGLGDRFIQRVQFVLDRISANPRMHQLVLDDVRKAVVQQFPYCVFYRVEETCIRVLAVFHTSRDPREWLRRV